MKTIYRSETEKYLHLTQKYCVGVGVDIGSQGSPVVPHAINLDLPPNEFSTYNSNKEPQGPIQLRGYADKLPFDSSSLDFVYCSHLLEDFEEWNPLLIEWSRVLRIGGYLIILIPDIDLWRKAMERGQPPNCSHKHEGIEGELTRYLSPTGFHTIKDERTNQFDGDYTILYVGLKIKNYGQ